MSISEVTRRNIFDMITVEKIRWTGRLDEVAFLGRIFNLNQMPSYDHRFSDAARDIYQHCIMNFDWEYGWIFSDPRFDLLHCEDEIFLKFLCEMIHPIVRPDKEDVDKLLKIFNDNLATDGWQLIEVMRISNKPVYAARPLIKGNIIQINTAKKVASKLDSIYISQQITRMESAIANDPELAIGTAKEFVETICKTILREHGEKLGRDDSLPDLVKKVRSKINLLPENISNKSHGSDAIKRLLSNLGSVAQALAELRGLYGSGHGKDVISESLEPRHARLVVGAAITLGVFLFETHEQENV